VSGDISAAPMAIDNSREVRKESCVWFDEGGMRSSTVRAQRTKSSITESLVSVHCYLEGADGTTRSE
jgi:isoleucyl-tRNA synthetase